MYVTFITKKKSTINIISHCFNNIIVHKNHIITQGIEKKNSLCDCKHTINKKKQYSDV